MRAFFLILIILGYFAIVFNYVTFTNLKCGTRGEKFVDFEKCFIKAVNRTHKYIDLHIKLHQKVVNNVTVIKLMRHNNGYKPFFVDITIDVCKFLKDPRQSIVKKIYDIYKNSSNVNHTCPYEDDVIVDHLWTGNLESDIMKFIPLIDGDYAIYSEWSVYNVARAFINIYIRVSKI
ncbi:GD14602 [Drosophila simulans]|uniref:GD14602 n=1 Tax=Drosophila simulans TaxID=7240 RepID=B4QLV3_DROSI|nr:GD14602 [Drosophila simulans]